MTRQLPPPSNPAGTPRRPGTRSSLGALLGRAIALGLLVPLAFADGSGPQSMRWVEVNGDDQLDLLELFEDGRLALSLGLGGRLFQPVEQELPRARVVDLLVEDLDGDGDVDLYLVTASRNFALVGDGTGLFTDATEQLGLRDEGRGMSAETRDADADGRLDLLLHNQTGDVLFWGVPGGFERDARTPFVPAPVDELVTSNPVAGEPGRAATPGSALEEPTIGRRPGGEPVRTRPPLAGPVEPAGGAEGGAEGGTPLASTVPIVGPAVPVAPDRGAPKLLIGVTPEQQEILGHLSLEQLPDGLGGTVKTVRLSSVNFQIVNGLGATNGNPGAPNSLAGTTNGLGNLIVGYNELGNPAGDQRGGSHNLVIGHGHTYTKFGGLVAGQDNTLNGAYATVSGGHLGVADGLFSSISGGKANTVINEYTSVSGGRYNVASLYGSSVAGGAYNSATGTDSSVSGGELNLASGSRSSVSGGKQNTASFDYATVSGGQGNLSSGLGAAVSGGQNNQASGLRASVSGGLGNKSMSYHASISGGSGNLATGFSSSMSGGQSNRATGNYSSVTGGRSNTAGAAWASVTGGEINSALQVYSSISGGRQNTASGGHSSVSGGRENAATGTQSSISGGDENTASGLLTSISGGFFNRAIGSRSSVSGGAENRSTVIYSSVTGGRGNTAGGYFSTVSGGFFRTAPGSSDWVAGALFQDS